MVSIQDIIRILISIYSFWFLFVGWANYVEWVATSRKKLWKNHSLKSAKKENVDCMISLCGRILVELNYVYIFSWYLKFCFVIFFKFSFFWYIYYIYIYFFNSFIFMYKSDHHMACSKKKILNHSPFGNWENNIL